MVLLLLLKAVKINFIIKEFSIQTGGTAGALELVDKESSTVFEFKVHIGLAWEKVTIIINITMGLFLFFCFSFTYIYVCSSRELKW